MAVLYNRHMALNLDFYRSPALSSDWESLYRLSLKGDVKYLDRNVGVWRLHQLNESTTKDPLRLFENLTIWSAIYGEAMMHGMSSIAAKYHSARCVAFFAQQSLVSLSKGSPQEFMIYFRQFIKTYKTSTIIMIFNPIYLMRLMLGFVGYYRYRNCKY
jgi:hypothetical protein